MNICMVGFSIGKTHGAFVGGHVNNVINLSRMLAKDGFKIHIVTTPPIHSSDLKECTYELQEGVKIHQINVSRGNSVKKTSEKGRLSLGFGAKSYPKIVSAIRRLHKKENFDVIHGHSGYPWVGLIPEYVKIREKVPSIHTLYCPINRSWFHQMVSRFCLSKLDLTIAISNNVKDSLRGVLHEIKLRVIPPLVDFSRFNYSSRQEKNDYQNILFLGNMSRAKGLHILLEALKIVRKDFPNIKLLIGLDMPLDELESRNLEIKEKIRALDLTENVILLGIVKDLPEVMARSEIFVAPFTSTYGPADYPLSILEAMASGLPVIATNVGGIPEIVRDGENGLLVEPNNPFELAEGITYLLQNEEDRKRMGRKGAEFVRDFSKNIVRNYESVYKELAGG